MRRAYRFGLFLYPRRYRDEFAEEMISVFEQARSESQAQGWGWYVRFMFGEVAGLIGGAAAVWMCQPNAPEVAAGNTSTAIPTELMEAQQRIERAIAGMMHAIANHQFERARMLSDEERVARENLRVLRAKYGTEG